MPAKNPGVGQGVGGGAPKGNQNNLKFKTPEARKEVFEELIKHLENAYDQASFGPCDWDTVESYIENFPDEFPAEDIAAAKRRGHKVLEEMLFGLARGEIQGNATTAIFVVKNKLPAHYRDRVENQVSGPNGEAVMVRIFDNLPAKN